MPPGVYDISFKVQGLVWVGYAVISGLCRSLVSYMRIGAEDLCIWIITGNCPPLKINPEVFEGQMTVSSGDAEIAFPEFLFGYLETNVSF